MNQSLGSSAGGIAERLSLQVCPEGGWATELSASASIATALKLLDRGMRTPWRRVDAATAWFALQGEAELEIFEPGAGVERRRLSASLAASAAASPAAIVPPYAWHRLSSADGAFLGGCAIAPGSRRGAGETAPQGWTPESPDPRFGPLLQHAIGDLGAESGSIHLRTDDGELHLIGSIGIPAPVLAIVRRVAVGKGMAGLAVERSAPVSACNIQTDRSGDVRPGARATGLEGAIVVPILDEAGTAVGALGVANRAARTFTAAETERLIEHGRGIARARLGR